MDVFKLFESTAPELQDDYTDAKDLRRDQLLDNYDAAVKALQCLIKAKENEVAYRRSLLEMLDQSKNYHDKKLAKAKEALSSVKDYIPDEQKSETPVSLSTTPISSGTTPAAPTTPGVVTSQSGDKISPISSYRPPGTAAKHPNSDLPIPGPTDRTSLDNRLTEFLKAYPILSQAGLAAPTSSTDSNTMNNSNSASVRPSPGYYTQQPPPPPPPNSITAAPPLMAMMRFPPPPMMPAGNNQQPPSLSNLNLANSQENHETADMDLSDHDEPTSGKAGIIPMVASAMQQGAGGKHGLSRSEQSSYGSSGYGNPVQYTSRMSTLPFDPSIMDPTFSSPMSSGSGSRDKHSHSDRSSHRHSSGGSSSSKHGSDKSSKYSSSSSKNKRR